MDQPAPTANRFRKLESACRGAGLPWPPPGLVELPRLLETIETAWGSAEGARAIDQLLLSDRPDRQGFSELVMREIIALRQLHAQLYPDAGRNPWDPFQRQAILTAPVQASAARAGEPMSPAANALPAPLVPGTTARPKAKPWPQVNSEESLRQHHTALKGEGKKRRTLIGQILVEYGHITQKQLDDALLVQRRVPQPLGKLLSDNGELDRATLAAALCLQASIPQVDLERLRLADSVRSKIPPGVLREYRCLPVGIVDGTLYVAVENPLDFSAREFLRFCAGSDVRLLWCPREQLRHHLDALTLSDSMPARELLSGRLPEGAQFVAGDEEDERNNHRNEINENDESVVGLVNRILSAAIDCKASDVHIEGNPDGSSTRVRFRRDGMMEGFTTIPREYHRAVVSRVKIMAQLDIAERRRPQDGKIVFLRSGQPRVDLRVSTIPGIRGIEFVTIRVLASGEPLPLDAIGMTPVMLARFKHLIGKPYGCVLVTGPTGSGKTTTLHSAISHLNDGERKIWTAEDPVEIVQPRICQVQTNARIGFDFAAALRAFLRADPDVIMIGEMRDQETARIAIEASMTGHLVLSTLHTNSTAEATARMIDLGVEPFSLSDALLGVIAQRLVRRLCRACARHNNYSAEGLDALAQEWHQAGGIQRPTASQRESIKAVWRESLAGGEQLQRWEAVGCNHCQGRGYRGRLGIYELFEVTPEVRELIRRKASAREFGELAASLRVPTLKQDGITKALAGMTTLQELRGACT